MRVKFSNIDEYLEELYEERGQVEDGILRVTFVHRQDSRTGLDHLSLYAGAVIRGKVVELRHFIGQMWHMPRDTEQDTKMSNAARALREKIIIRARELNIEVRAGMFEP